MRVYPLTQFILISIAVIILSLLYFYFPAASSDFYPKCIFHQLTGLHCPGCGSQRAISAVLHGQILQAFHNNLLLVLSAPLIVYSAAVFSWNVFSRKKLQQRLFYSPAFILVFLTAVILFTVFRNIPVAPFNWLAPA